MKTADLGGPILASVSRSFYLTIRLLPGAVREPVGLAYLLARASDTIADSTATPAASRLTHLTHFWEMISTGDRQHLPQLQKEILTSHPGEQNLLAQLPRCLDWLEALSELHRAEITRVLNEIIEGQTLDLRRFSQKECIVALQTAAELDRYTYLVAGCVGQFWTRICLAHLPRYARLPADPLCQAGIRFGMGLQLVNILRDLRADLAEGRCYLPEEELRAAGLAPDTLLSSPQLARPVVENWINRAEDHLEGGRVYIEALRSARVRAACFLPWRLGVQTLDLLRLTPPLETTARVKVPRSAVRGALALALPVAFSNRVLNGLHRN